MRFTKYLLYADNLQSYLQGLTLEIHQLLEKVNSDIQTVYEWWVEQRLFFNSAKTKITVLGTRHMLDNIDSASLPNISISNILISYVTSVKNLGVIINSTLSWNENVTHVLRKIWYSLSRIKNSTCLLYLNVRKYLITSAIFFFDWLLLLGYDEY